MSSRFRYVLLYLYLNREQVTTVAKYVRELPLQIVQSGAPHLVPECLQIWW